ncbi:MAG: motility associated factor glycosyltransferase family protein [Spirochaetota bacterium]
MPTLRIEGRYVHSRHDPAREARRAMADLARRDPPAVVMLGLGLGYHATFLLAHTDQAHVIAFEPSQAVIEMAHGAGTLPPPADHHRITIATTDEQFLSALSRYAAEGFAVFELSGRTEADDAFAAAKTAAKSFASRVEINRNTLHRFGRLWVRNLCRNLPRLAGAASVTGLADAFRGLPALLLAAGPTLDQILPALPDLAARCVVIAVDTALDPALRAGVTPDFAVVVDPQYWNARHLDRVHLPDTVLVSEPSAHPRVFRSFPNAIHLCSSVFPLGRAFEESLGRFGSLGAGGSVATTAWDLARLLGATSIHVAGLDLGFPGGRTHCRGSFFEELALALALRTAPAEAVVFRYTWGADSVPVPANDGSALLSDRRMAIYRSWFASQLALPGAPRTAAITRGGSSIAGLDVSSAEDIMRLPPKRDKIDARRRLLIDAPAPDAEPRLRRLLDQTVSMELELSDLVETASAASGEMERIRASHAAGENVDFSPLKPIDDALGAHPAGAIGSFLVQEAIERVREGYGSSSIAEQIDASTAIYRGLAEAARFHAEELRRARDFLAQVSERYDRR